MSEINPKPQSEVEDDLVAKLRAPISERLTNVLYGIHIGLDLEFSEVAADMAAAAERISSLEQQVARLEQKIEFLSAATNRNVDLVEMSKDALQTCIVSMEGECSANHKIAMGTADRAFHALSNIEALPLSPEAGGLLAIAEQNKWAIFPQTGGGWVIESADDYGDDGQEREIVRTRKSLTAALVEAVEEELPQEFEWLLLASRKRQLAYVPDGWKIVPVKLSKAMEDAAYDAVEAYEKAETGVWLGLSSTYDAIIANTPTPPQRLFPLAKGKADEKVGWDAETYFGRLVDYAWEDYQTVVFDLETVKPMVGQYLAANRKHLRKIYAEAREKFPEFADTLLWLLRYKGIEANRHSNLSESFGVGRFVPKDDESLWTHWKQKALRSERCREAVTSALKTIVTSASVAEAEMALVKMSDIREGEAALLDADSVVKSGGAA